MGGLLIRPRREKHSEGEVYRVRVCVHLRSSPGSLLTVPRSSLSSIKRTGRRTGMKGLTGTQSLCACGGTNGEFVCAPWRDHEHVYARK